MKFKILTIIILMLILATSAYSQVIDRPEPPTIHEWVFPPNTTANAELPYYPVGCVDKNSCGVVCYYINEGDGNYEISCLPFVFE